tara:strand:+ start:216 stop:1112 length:897 start_codon:yes stop_codon:yes gene_type:complete
VIKVTNIQVRSFDLGYLDLYWDISPCHEDINNYEFVVEKSDNEFGPYEDLTIPFTDRYHVRDNTVAGQHSFYRKIYYRIRVQERANTSNFEIFPEVGGARLAAKPDLIALEMARINNLKLKEFTGRKVWVFTRKTSGQRCRICFDDVSQRKLIANCSACYGTGWVGGYNAPIEAYALIVTPNEQTIHANVGNINLENTSMMMGNYPELSEGDIVVEAENIRWRVASTISKVSKARALIRQQAPVHRIPKSDVEYMLPINLSDEELRDLIVSPERNYTNPQTIEGDSLKGALTNIFGEK